MQFDYDNMTFEELKRASSIPVAMRLISIFLVRHEAIFDRCMEELTDEMGLPAQAVQDILGAFRKLTEQVAEEMNPGGKLYEVIEKMASDMPKGNMH